MSFSIKHTVNSRLISNINSNVNNNNNRISNIDKNVNDNRDKIDTLNRDLKNSLQTVLLYSGGSFITSKDTYITYVQSTVIDNEFTESVYEVYIDGVLTRTINFGNVSNPNNALINLSTLNEFIAKNSIITIKSSASAEFLIHFNTSPEDVIITLDKEIALGQRQRDTLFYISNLPKILDNIFN